MKKILTIAALAASTAFVHAQGSIITYSIAGAFAVSTNNVVSGAVGKIATVANGGAYDFALLVASYTGNGTVSATATPFTFSALSGYGVAVAGITNGTSAGGIFGPGHVAGSATAGTLWAPSQDTLLTDGTEDYYMLVGWSANLGSSWSQVESEVAGGNYAGYFGYSAVGYGFTGGGPNNLPTPSIFGVSSAEPGGLASGFDLVSAVPEPSTIALAAMGGLSLLAFRRKKA